MEVSPSLVGGRTWTWDRPYVMGVLNVTPDSFSDGGRYLEVEAAVAHALAMERAGADLVDVGGESTRPGAVPVPAAQEAARVVPVIQRLARLSRVQISVDTYKAEVADAALAAGASWVNDVSGLTLDPDIARVAARHGAGLVIGHMRGTPRNMQDHTDYEDCLREVTEALEASVARALEAGVPRERIVVDPGIGFGKTAEQNLDLILGAGYIRRRLGLPVLVGPSRKSFIGKLTGAPVAERVPGTLAACTVAVLSGADLVRVHDVAEARQAVDLAGWFGSSARWIPGWSDLDFLRDRVWRHRDVRDQSSL